MPAEYHINILQKLGLTIHPIKSCSAPKQSSMTVKKDKNEKIKRLCLQLLTPLKVFQRELASAFCNTVASLTAVLYGPLFYRSLKRDMLEAIKISEFDFDTYLTLSDK